MQVFGEFRAQKPWNTVLTEDLCWPSLIGPRRKYRQHMLHVIVVIVHPRKFARGICSTSTWGSSIWRTDEHYYSQVLRSSFLKWNEMMNCYGYLLRLSTSLGSCSMSNSKLTKEWIKSRALSHNQNWVGDNLVELNPPKVTGVGPKTRAGDHLII